MTLTQNCLAVANVYGDRKHSHVAMFTATVAVNVATAKLFTFSRASYSEITISRSMPAVNDSLIWTAVHSILR